jgi:hypothetical protein
MRIAISVLRIAIGEGGGVVGCRFGQARKNKIIKNKIFFLIDSFTY